jgi:putative ABC transport system permease protein
MIRWIQQSCRHGIVEKQLDSELRFHLEQQVAEYVTRGMTPEEAYRRAQVELGGIEQVRQKCRERRWENHVDDIFRDVRLAMRRLRKEPRFSVTAILALGLGIGSTTVVFSVVYSLLFQPFAYRDSQRSIVFQIHDLSEAKNAGRAVLSMPEFVAFRQQNRVFEDVVGYNNAVNVSYNDGSGTREIFGTRGSESHAGAGGAYVTTNTFDYYGVSPFLGRGILQEDGRPGAPPVFVMNFRLWQAAFHGDPKVVGKSFLLNGEPRTLVGIMPPRFQIYGAGVWLPLGLDPSSTGTVRTIGGMYAVGRLKSGISLEAAAADLTGIARGLSKIYPNQYPARFTVTTETLLNHLLGKFKSTLYALLAAVFLLLLIACMNVATLLLARAATRQGEIALRTSLGASRSRLIRQLLIEAFVLAAASCLLGCFLAYGSLKWLVALIPAHMIPDGVVIQLSPAVLTFAAAVSIATTLLCGLVPSFHAVGRNLQGHLAGFGKGADTAARPGSLRTILVIAEIALSIVLLSGATLMMRSFFALTHVDLGFDPYSVLYVRLDLPKGRYDAAGPRNSLLSRILQQVATLPGVRATAETWSLPPDDRKWSDVAIPGKIHSQEWDANTNLCSEGYFQTLGLPLLRGRLFSEGDVESARHVAVINQTLARRFFGNDNPIGQRIKFNQFDKLPETPHDAYFEVIGLVADYRNAGLRTPPVPEAFMPYTISPLLVPNILARTTLNPSLLLKSVDQAVWALDPQVGIDMSGSLGSLLDEYEYEQPRFEFVVLGAFSGIGLLLVTIGIYGVMAYVVSLRTHEIGIRVALGAQSRTILHMVLKKGLGMIATGILIGVLASLGLTRFLASQLWGVSITDPWTFALVATCFLVVGLSACFFPARHAAQVDPLITLRYE